MAIHKIKLPLDEETLKKIKAGDSIYVTGRIVTARDEAHQMALEFYEEGKPLPVDFSKLGIYHCGPIRKKNDATGEWEVVAAGPTTSTRMEIFEDKFIEAFGTRLIIGKGGMGERTAKACAKFGAIYGMFTGGAALLAKKAVKRVVEVHWLEELGMPECLWVLEVEDFGPLFVGIDSYGRNIFTEIDTTTRELKKKAYEIIESAEV